MNGSGSTAGDKSMGGSAVSPAPAGDGTGASPRRVYYLDSLRVLAMVIVFMFHALHPFDDFGWHIKNDEQSLILTIAMAFLST